MANLANEYLKEYFQQIQKDNEWFLVCFGLNHF